MDASSCQREPQTLASAWRSLKYKMDLILANDVSSTRTTKLQEKKKQLREALTLSDGIALDYVNTLLGSESCSSEEADAPNTNLAPDAFDVENLPHLPNAQKVYRTGPSEDVHKAGLQTNKPVKQELNCEEFPKMRPDERKQVVGSVNERLTKRQLEANNWVNEKFCSQPQKGSEEPPSAVCPATSGRATRQSDGENQAPVRLLHPFDRYLVDDEPKTSIVKPVASTAKSYKTLPPPKNPRQSNDASEKRNHSSGGGPVRGPAQRPPLNLIQSSTDSQEIKKSSAYGGSQKPFEGVTRVPSTQSEFMNMDRRQQGSLPHRRQADPIPYPFFFNRQPKSIREAGVTSSSASALASNVENAYEIFDDDYDCPQGTHQTFSATNKSTQYKSRDGVRGSSYSRGDENMYFHKTIQSESENEYAYEPSGHQQSAHRSDRYCCDGESEQNQRTMAALDQVYAAEDSRVAQARPSSYNASANAACKQGNSCSNYPQSCQAPVNTAADHFQYPRTVRDLKQKDHPVRRESGDVPVVALPVPDFEYDYSDDDDDDDEDDEQPADASRTQVSKGVPATLPRYEEVMKLQLASADDLKPHDALQSERHMYDIKICSVTSQRDFYVMLKKDEPKFGALEDDLSTCQEYESLFGKEVQVGDPCAVCEDGGRIMRGVVEHRSTQDIRVFLVDYGDFTHVSRDCVGPLLQRHASLPMMAIHCCILGAFRIAQRTSTVFSFKKTFAPQTEWKMKVCRRSLHEQCLYEVDLYDLSLRIQDCFLSG